MPVSPKVRKWLVGCTVTLVSAVLLFGLIAYAGYWWVSIPGPQVDTQWLVGSETVAIAHWDHPFEDEGTRELISSVSFEAQQQQNESLEELSGFLALIAKTFQPSREDYAARLENEMPRQVTAILERVGAEEEVEPALILNFNRFPRAMRLAATIASRVSDEGGSYRGFIQFPFGGGHLTFVDDTAVWAGSERVLHQILDRAAGLPNGPERRRLPAGEGMADPRWDLFAMVENRGESLAYLFALLQDSLEKRKLPAPEKLPAELFDSVEEIRLGVDITSDDSATVAIKVRCLSRAACQPWKSYLEATFGDGARAGTLLGAFRLNQAGSAIDAEIDLIGFRQHVVAFMAHNDGFEKILEAKSPSEQ